MKYKYIPDSININILEQKDLSYEKILELQIKYRESFENIIKEYIDFKDIDNLIEDLPFNIPLINDTEYNFYHKFSTLGSKYVFIRNNIHIERLEENELQIVINAINNNTLLDKQFVLDTISKVMFEEGNTACYGTALPENMIKAKSITFEFAYEDYKCDIQQGRMVKEKFSKVFKYILEKLGNYLNVEYSIIIFNGFDNIYKYTDNDMNIN